MLRDFRTCVFDGFGCIIEHTLIQSLLSMQREVKGHGKIKESYYRLSTRLGEIYTKQAEFPSGNQNGPRF